jgi:hypothetical protein
MRVFQAGSFRCSFVKLSGDEPLDEDRYQEGRVDLNLDALGQPLVTPDVVEPPKRRAGLRHLDLDVVRSVGVALEPVAEVLELEDEADLLRLGAVSSPAAPRAFAGPTPAASLPSCGCGHAPVGSSHGVAWPRAVYPRNGRCG